MNLEVFCLLHREIKHLPHKVDRKLTSYSKSFSLKEMKSEEKEKRNEHSGN